MAQRFDRGHWPAAGENTRLINYAPSPGAGQSRGLWNVVPQTATHHSVAFLLNVFN